MRVEAGEGDTQLASRPSLRRRRIGRRELARDELSVEPALGEELLVRAAFGDAALVEDDDAVGVADGREAVGDDDGGALRLEAREGAAHRLLVDRVQMRGRLVEDEDGRVLEDGPGDRDALALAAL